LAVTIGTGIMQYNGPLLCGFNMGIMMGALVGPLSVVISRKLSKIDPLSIVITEYYYEVVIDNYVAPFIPEYSPGEIFEFRTQNMCKCYNTASCTTWRQTYDSCCKPTTTVVSPLMLSTVVEK